MTSRYADRFRRLVDELRSHPRIVITDLEIGEPADPEALAAAPPGMEVLYGDMDGFLLEWRHFVPGLARGDDADTGAIDLLPIGEVTKDWCGVTWSEDEGDDRFRSVKPLDFFVPEACAAFVTDAGGISAPSIHYHVLGDTLCDTGYTFPEYLDRLLAARGSWYWIEALCEETRHGLESRRFFERMPLLFEDFDPGLFTPGTGR